MPEIGKALKHLRQILSIEAGQKQLTESLRLSHLDILHFFLEEGCSPGAGDIPIDLTWLDTLQRLESVGLIVLEADQIMTAYPFSAIDRGFNVTPVYGQTQAVCAFDALAVSSIFRVATRIDAICRLSNQAITMEQEYETLESAGTVFAAIDWSATDHSQSCSASPCTEMLFIGSPDLANDWQSENSSQRQLFKTVRSL
ncbi:MAG: hypothetical protein ACI845_001781 [Gammaproteobacteria bacterium]|jgi:hypothetical protein